MKTYRLLLLPLFVAAALNLSPALATASSPVWGPGISAESYPVTLHGAQEGYLDLKLPGREALCSGITFTGTLAERSTIADSSSVSNPGCGGFGYIRFNGCQLSFRPSAAGALGIGPSGCTKRPEMAIESCRFFLPESTSLNATYETVGSGSKTEFKINVKDPHTEYISEGECGKAGTHNELSIEGTFVVHATTTGFEETAVGTEAVTGGVYIEGSTSPKLEAANYPVTFSASTPPSPFLHELTLLEVLTEAGGRQFAVACENGLYSGGISNPVSSLSLTATSFSGCKLSGERFSTENVTVAPNGCRSQYGEFKYVEPSVYRSHSELSCSHEEGIKISTTGSTPCVLEIRPQAFAGEETLVGDAAINHVSGVGVLAAAKGVKYSSNWVCAADNIVATGSHENGITRTDLWVTGSF